MSHHIGVVASLLYYDLESLGQYVSHYAQKMVDAAGQALRPLFDPSLDEVMLPTLARQPFVPQGWLIEAVRRSLA